MDSHRLRHLLAFAQHGTHQRAAVAVGMTQPAFTRSLQALEQEVGVPLIERRGRGSVLTDAGQLLVERARRVLREESEAYRALQLLHAGEVGRLQVGMSSAVHLLAVDDFVRTLARERPRLHTEIVTGDTAWLCRRLHDETLDVVAGDAGVLLGDPALEVMAFAAVRVGLFCRPGHPVLTGGAPVPVARLYDYQVASFPFTPTAERSVVARMGSDAALSTLVTLVLSDAPTLLRLVAASDTLLAANLFLVHRDLVAGRLVEVPIGLGDVVAHRLAVAHLAGRTPSPAMTAFRACVQRNVEAAHAAIAAWEGGAATG